MMHTETDAAPIDPLLPELLVTLDEHATVLLQAPPGAGKTTRVPPALLGAKWRRDKRILMLEPRRLAARAAARYMAGRMHEPVGRTVGFRTRLETRVSAATRIEVVTEGILIRMLQRDPELSDYAAVLFDEFHERSLNADLGLALARESQQALCPDLRLLVMSATLDAAPLARLLDDAPVLSSEGRGYPVDMHYRSGRADQPLADQVRGAILHALREHDGSLLVFLPGEAEIRAVARRLDGALDDRVDLHPLFGALPPTAQDAAIAPAPAGRRKIVLATAIAETSLTIDGVRVVIDAGCERRAEFDPNSGMSRLVTARVSRSAAEQRAGRAGRTEPGVCYRLWPEREHARLAAHSPPEIRHADLAGLVLELARWGARSPDGLAWLDPPPEAHWRQASDLLRWLDALDDAGAITATGTAMLDTGLHPRLAHMLVRGRERNLGATAARLAALLSERDVLGRDAGADIEPRLRALDGRAGRMQRIRQLAKRLERPGDSSENVRPEACGGLLALAWPDRIAQRRGGAGGRYLLANGRGARLDEDDPLITSEWLVAAELDGQAREARIFRAAHIDRETVEQALAAHIERVETAEWDDARGTVVVRGERRLGSIVLDGRELGRPTPEQLQAGLLVALRTRGREALRWSDGARQFGARVEFIRHGIESLREQWPAFDDEALAAEMDQWLAPFLAGMSHWREVEALDLMPALKARLGHQRLAELDRLAPAALDVPAGARVRLDYAADPGPVLAVKLQAVFGWTENPRVLDGRAPVVLHLLSPAARPLAITADLASFWTNAYPDVLRDMRGRYPKHPWPDDPLSAAPTLKARRRKS